MTGAYKNFKKVFGAPRAGSSIEPSRLRLDGSADLDAFAKEVGNGVFSDGLISIMSKRELVDGLGGWEAWLPKNARLFGSTAFGLLFITTTLEDVWLIDTQYGQVVESDFAVAEFIEEFADTETRETYLKPDLFDIWNKMVGHLPDDAVLSPTPMIPMAGDWAPSSLSAMSMSVYISITGQLFAPGAGMPAQVRRLG